MNFENNYIFVFISNRMYIMFAYDIIRQNYYWKKYHIPRDSKSSCISRDPKRKAHALDSQTFSNHPKSSSNRPDQNLSQPQYFCTSTFRVTGDQTYKFYYVLSCNVLVKFVRWSLENLRDYFSIQPPIYNKSVGLFPKYKPNITILNGYILTTRVLGLSKRIHFSISRR